MSDENLKGLTLEDESGPVNIAFRDQGEGMPVLLLHGFFGQGGDFAHLPELGQGMRRIIPDLRGHGRSKHPGKRFRFHEAADDLLRLLDHLHIDRCCAVGLSGGALTLLRMAVKRPEALTKLVLVSACDGFPAEARVFMAAHAAEDAPFARELRAGAVHSHAQLDALLATAHAWAIGDDDATLAPEELASISSRTLLVTGENDPLYPLEVAQRLARSLVHATLWSVPGGGHTPVFGAHRAEFTHRVQAFFESGG